MERSLISRWISYISFLIKRLAPKRFLGRAVVIIVAPLLLVQIVLAWFFFDRHSYTVQNTMASSITGTITSTLKLLEHYPHEKDWILEHARNHYYMISVHFFPNEKLATKAQTQTKQGWVYGFLDRSLKRSVDRPYNMTMDEDWIYFETEILDGKLSLTLLRKRLFSRSTFVVMFLTSGSSFLLLLIALLFMQKQVRPLRRLAEKAEEFGKGHDTGAIKPQGAFEVRQMALAFNNMRERIKRQITQRTAMLAGVSHDLRTPLTRMKLQLALLPEHHYKTSLEEEVIDMEKMIEAYLAFVKGADREESKQVNVHYLLENLVKIYKNRGAIINYSSSSIPTLLLKPISIERCFKNLFDNAVRYAHSIHVTLKNTPHIVEIIIEDDGPGIPEESFEDVFKPFYRLEASRNVDTGGVGLGLSIARDIIHAHGGQIYLAHSNKGGLKVRVCIPY